MVKVFQVLYINCCIMITDMIMMIYWSCIVHTISCIVFSGKNCLKIPMSRQIYFPWHTIICAIIYAGSTFHIDITRQDELDWHAQLSKYIHRFILSWMITLTLILWKMYVFWPNTANCTFKNSVIAARTVSCT